MKITLVFSYELFCYHILVLRNTYFKVLKHWIRAMSSHTSCLTLGKLYLTFPSLVSSSLKWNELVEAIYAVRKFLGFNQLVFIQAPNIMSGTYKCSINANC